MVWSLSRCWYAALGYCVAALCTDMQLGTTVVSIYVGALGLFVGALLAKASASIRLIYLT